MWWSLEVWLKVAASVVDSDLGVFVGVVDGDLGALTSSMDKSLGVVGIKLDTLAGWGQKWMGGCSR